MLKLIRITPSPATVKSIFQSTQSSAIKQTLSSRVKNISRYKGQDFNILIRKINRQVRNLYKYRLSIFHNPGIVSKENSFVVTREFLKDENNLLQALTSEEIDLYSSLFTEFVTNSSTKGQSLRSLDGYIAKDTTVEYSTIFPVSGMGSYFFPITVDNFYKREFRRNPTISNSSIGCLYHVDISSSMMTLYRIGTYSNIFNVDLTEYYFPRDETLSSYILNKQKERNKRAENEIYT